MGYVVELDLDKDGTFEEDISAYVEGIQTTTGRDRPSQLTGKASPGKLTVNVENSDNRFSDFNSASPYYGLLVPGTKIRFRDSDVETYDIATLARDRFRRDDGALGTTEIGGAWVGAGNHHLWRISGRSATPATGDEIANNIPVDNLSNLEAYWPLQEQIGTRFDMTANNNDLGDSNTGRSEGPGMAYPYAANFSGSGVLFIGDNASLSTGDIDFTIAGWVRIVDKSSSRIIISKWTTSNFEWNLKYDSSTDRYQFVVSANGTSSVTVTASTYGSPIPDEWIFITAWHDAAANTVNIQVNNGVVNSQAHSAGVFSGTAIVVFGADGALNTPLFEGDIAGVSFWKRILTADERRDLYNSFYISTLTVSNTTAVPVDTNDVYIQVTIDPGTTPENLHQMVGMVFRYSDDENFSFIVVNVGAGQIQYWQRVAGIETLYAATGVEVYSNMSLGLLTVGQALTVYLEGIPVIRANIGEDYIPNKVGIFARRGQESLAPFITDFRVWNHLPAQQGRGENLCSNGDFETDVDDWTATNGTINQSVAWAKTGSDSARITATGVGDFGATHTVSLSGDTTGLRFVVSGTLRVAASQAVIGKLPELKVSAIGGAIATINATQTFPAFVAGEQYVEFAFEIQQNDRTSLTVYFGANSGVSGDEFFLDDVQIKLTQDLVEGIFWTGQVEEVLPVSQTNTVNSAQITANGTLAGLARMDVTPPLATIGQYTGYLMGSVLSQAKVLHPPGKIDRGDIQTGTFVMSRGSALNIARDIEEVELGFLYESQEGDLIYRSRSHRDSQVTPISTFTDSGFPVAGYITFDTIGQQSWVGDIFNAIEAGVSPYSLGVQAELFLDENKHILALNEHVDLVASSADVVARWLGHERKVSTSATPSPFATHSEVIATADKDHVCQVPAFTLEGYLTFVVARFSPNPGSVSTPTNWIRIAHTDNTYVWAKVIEAADLLTSIDYTTSELVNSVSQAFSVVNWGSDEIDFEDAIVVSGFNLGVTNYPVPPEIFWDWGPIPTLVYAFCNMEDNNTFTPPSNMTEDIETNVNGDLADISQTGAYNIVTDAEGFIPLPFSPSGFDPWETITIAVRGLLTSYTISDSLPSGQSGEFSISYVSSIGGTLQIHEQIKAQGIPIIKGSDINIKVEDIPSQDKHGILSYRNSANLFKTSLNAQTYANLILARYKDRHPVINIAYRADQDEEHYTQAVQRRVGDRIKIIASGSGLGLSQDFFIESITHDVQGKAHSVSYELSWAL